MVVEPKLYGFGFRPALWPWCRLSFDHGRGLRVPSRLGKDWTRRLASAGMCQCVPNALQALQALNLVVGRALLTRAAAVLGRGGHQRSRGNRRLVPPRRNPVLNWPCMKALVSLPRPSGCSREMIGNLLAHSCV